METTIEHLQNRTVSEALGGIRDCLLDLRDELISVGVPLESIEIENWPKFDKDDVHIKLWDGNDYIKSTGIPGRTYITPMDIITLVKRRQILKRKYNGI